MPTDFYWLLGSEILSGKKLQAHDVQDSESIGVNTAFSKFSGDLNLEHHWQLGLNHLHNINAPLL